MQKTENFIYKATIDWIELEIVTVKKSNFDAVRKLAGVKFAKAMNPEDGGAADIFRLRFHDITSWTSLENKIKDFAYFKPLSSVTITGVEVSFDAYSKTYNKKELIEKTAEFYWLLQNPCSINRRVVTNYKGSAEQLQNHAATIRKVTNSYSILIGSQSNDSISQRIYYKTLDSAELIPLIEHRARYEITLVNDACPFKTIEEAKAYKFTDLSKWFKFRKIKDNLDKYKLMLISATRQLGRINRLRRVGGGVLVNNVGTHADIALNRITYDKLRELTKRLQKKRVTRKLRVTH